MDVSCLVKGVKKEGPLLTSNQSGCLKLECIAEALGRELKAWQAMDSLFGHLILCLIFQCKTEVLNL